MSAPLTDADEELLRQVHPVMLGEDGQPARTAFTPSTRDAGMLSTLRGSVGAQEAHRRHVEDRELASAGTWAVTVGEVDGAGCAALDDATDLGVVDHASVNFTNAEGPAAVKRAARKLRDAAAARGCLYSL